MICEEFLKPVDRGEGVWYCVAVLRQLIQLTHPLRHGPRRATSLPLLACGHFPLTGGIGPREGGARMRSFEYGNIEEEYL